MTSPLTTLSEDEVLFRDAVAAFANEEVRPLVGGEAYTPFSRVATGVDFTSPTANGAETGLDFINSDVTLYLHRQPVGEWIGYEVTDHQSAEGVALGHCRLHDIEGPVGFSSCAALAQRRS